MSKRFGVNISRVEKEDDMECHWSPYCQNQGVEYVTVHVDDKPFSVWACEGCR